MTDTTLVEVYQERTDVTQQAASGIRTRRKELVERGLVRWTGNFERLESGRRSRVWEAAKSTKRRMLKRRPDEEIS